MLSSVDKTPLAAMLDVQDFRHPMSDASRQCNLSDEMIIEDVFPCTDFQEDAMALSQQHPRFHVDKYLFRISQSVEISRLKAAWEATVATCANLRTRIVVSQGSVNQVVVKETASWDWNHCPDLTTALEAAEELEMTYGSRLCQYAIVKGPENYYYFVLALNTTIYDEWTMQLIMETLQRFYSFADPSPVIHSHARFVEYTKKLDWADARKYWQTQLESAKWCAFPLRKTKCNASAQIYQPRALFRKDIAFSHSKEATVTGDHLLRAAWAILLARYSDTDDVCYGMAVSGRHAPVDGLDRVVGKVHAVIPCRALVKKDSTVKDFLQQIQSQALEATPYEQFGLRNISKFGVHAREICNFSSLLIVQQAKTSNMPETDTGPILEPTTSDHMPHGNQLPRHSGYGLVLQLNIHDKYLDFQAIYDPTVLVETQVTSLFHHFDRIIQQLLSPDDKMLLRDVSLSGPYDLEQAKIWNGERTDMDDECFHSMITKKAQQTPDAPAIHAWDGSFTYGELDAAADRLAFHLARDRGVESEALVHVCFEKSAWFFVAILAINKAGGAWVPLEPTHPIQRQQQVVQRTQARLALSSPANAERCIDLGLEVLQVTAALDASLADVEAQDLSQGKDRSTATLPPSCKATPQNAAYVLFTSGSTGTPKGLVIEHGSLCISQIALAERLGLTADTRMLQFASYVFDSCIGEIVAPLLFGGCVCVPSDEMRWNGLPEFIRTARVTAALLTPSFIRTFKPAEVPSLNLLIIASESPSQDNLDTWLGSSRLVNAWGPAEICVISALHEWKSTSESPLTVGRPLGGFCWIVSEEDHERLAPIGCVGEVVVQSPTILREYLSDPERTKKSIVTPVPSWMPRCKERKWNRLFKTGDLGFYNPDGTIEFVGRKDTQVKIRGQRVELEEVEYNIKTLAREVQQVVVDVFKTEARASLVAYICFSCDIRQAAGEKQSAMMDEMNDMFLPMTEETKQLVQSLIKGLGARLPSYMVPTMFIPCQYMPFTTKLDRGRLRRKTAELDREHIARYSLTDSEKQAPRTAAERHMQQLWASILKIPVDTIGRDDSFLQIGGDSIGVIRLVSLARQQGIALTVPSIFEDSRLSHLAAIAGSAVNDAATLPPFSLLPEDKRDELLDLARRQSGLSKNETIEDAYPCTPLQEGLMALAIKQPGSYLTKWRYKLSPDTDVTRFKIAWEQTIALCDNLRTRIILADTCCFQVIVKADIVWDSQSFLDGIQELEIVSGSRLWRYALSEEEDGQTYFTLVAHHTVFDGWSFGLVMQRLETFYKHGEALSLDSYSRFIQYIGSLDREVTRRYWAAQLLDAKQTTFPSPRKLECTPSTQIMTDGSAIRSLRTQIYFSQSATSSVTKATIIRAAWAIVLARYCDTQDVCFGLSVSGRHAPVPGIESMSGPLVATVPIRLRLDAKQTVDSFLRDVQAHASNMVPHEQFGLQNIIKLSENARAACYFTSLLVIQPAEIHVETKSKDPIMISAAESGLAVLDEYFGYPLVVQALLNDTGAEFYATYDSAVMAELQITALSHHLDRVVQQLLSGGEKLLSDISLAGPWDLEQAKAWNEKGPEIINDCIHRMIERQACLRPQEPAICAWDGELTYEELNTAADRLARYLAHELGIMAGDLVHVCFEKSVWFYVSILAINKAGGAWVPMDPSHPIRRQEVIVQQTKSTVALVSEANAEMCTNLGLVVVKVSAALDKALKDNNASDPLPLPAVTSKNAAYVLFTSGSTGTPKGVIVEHGAICTSQVAVAERLGLTAEVRMLQFSAYAFDVFVFESICSLIAGACICVPSDSARMTNLEAFMNETSVNWADLTPTFARTVDSNKIQNLEVLVIGGETASPDILQKWCGKTRLVNAWGPAETCVIGTLHEYTSIVDSPLTIGRPVGGACWIVDPGQLRLAPIGCIGELVVQGPSLLREYLSDPKKTEAAIRPVPEWMPRGAEPAWSRLFKTGDLAFYNPDGTIRFVGRKDTQVKIRGQRVELGEIEHNIQTIVDEAKQVAVDIVQKEDGVSLVAYLCFNHETRLVGKNTTEATTDSIVVEDMGDLFLPLTEEMEKQMQRLAEELGVRLPSYMVPKMFIPCRYMPFITSTKLDRRKLREKTEALSSDDVTRYSMVDSKKRGPRTRMEYQMQQLWSSVLKIPAEAIGRDDSFLQLGGDSITAIRLVLQARSHGIVLTVASIFKDARLSHLAATAAEQYLN